LDLSVELFYLSLAKELLAFDLISSFLMSESS